MTRLEDGLRDVLTEHAARVLPTTGWEQSVLASARRRQLQRRMAATVGAAVAVVVVMMVANVMLPLPPDLSRLDPAARMNGQSGRATAVQASASGGPIQPSKLRTGVAPAVAYAVGDGGAGAKSSDVVVLPNGERWKTGASVTSLEEAGDGVVVELASQANQLMYRWPGGTRELARGNLAGFAVSPDGTRVAWSQTGKDGRLPAVLRLAELPSGRLLSWADVDPSELDQNSGVPFVSSFAGDLVTLSYDVPADEGSLSAWNTANGAIQPMAGKDAQDDIGTLMDVSVRADMMLVLDRKRCLVSVSLVRPGDERWRACDRSASAWPAAKRLSPLGTQLAGVNGSQLWVRDARTGKLLWSRELAGATADALVWESDDQVLVTYSRPGDTSAGRTLLRCSAAAPHCERPATMDGLLVTALADRQGPPVPPKSR